MIKLILIIFGYVSFFSEYCFAQIPSVGCFDCGGGLRNLFSIREIVYYLCAFILFFSLIGLFFKRIRKICQWILIVTSVLLAIFITSAMVVDYVVQSEAPTYLDPSEKVVKY